MALASLGFWYTLHDPYSSLLFPPFEDVSEEEVFGRDAAAAAARVARDCAAPCSPPRLFSSRPWWPYRKCRRTKWKFEFRVLSMSLHWRGERRCPSQSVDNQLSFSWYFRWGGLWSLRSWSCAINGSGAVLNSGIFWQVNLGLLWWVFEMLLLSLRLL